MCRKIYVIWHHTSKVKHDFANMHTTLESCWMLTWTNYMKTIFLHVDINMSHFNMDIPNVDIIQTISWIKNRSNKSIEINYIIIHQLIKVPLINVCVIYILFGVWYIDNFESQTWNIDILVYIYPSYARWILTFNWFNMSIYFTDNKVEPLYNLNCMKYLKLA